MDSSEIEVVPLDSNSHQNPIDSPAITDVFSASAYGDLHQLKRLVEHNNSSVSLPDANGFYALQWAALNNSLDVAQYIIEVYAYTLSSLLKNWSVSVWQFSEIGSTFTDSLLYSPCDQSC